MGSRLIAVSSALLLLLGPIHPQPPATALKPMAARRAMLERALVHDLQEHVGAARRWVLNLNPHDISAPDADTIPEAVIRGINVRVPQGPVVSEIVLALRDLQFDPATHDLQGARQARMSVTLRAAELERIASAQNLGPVGRLRIHCHPGAIVVRAVARTHGFGIPVAVRGVPKVRGTQILFDVDRASVMNLRMPRRFIDRLEASVNPLADLATINVPARLDRISIGEDVLVAEGSLEMSSGLEAAR